MVKILNFWANKVIFSQKNHLFIFLEIRKNVFFNFLSVFVLRPFTKAKIPGELKCIP